MTYTALFFLFFSAYTLGATVYEDGRVRLDIDRSNGRFSLYYMTDVDKKKFEPLFWDRDKKTSFFSVYLNGTEHRLGESSRFKIYHRGTEQKPALMFESPQLAVTIEFSFIRTASSGVSNGVRIDLKMENWEDKTQQAGMRFLVDTFLGEKQNPNFRTDLRQVGSELIIDQSSRDRWWLSQNTEYGLMGSIFVEDIDSPDFVEFANWKRLYNAKFKAEYVQTRNFNDGAFSVRDSAVCYYLDTGPLEKWETRGFTVLLAAEDRYGFDAKKTQPAVAEQVAEVVRKVEVELGLIPERYVERPVAPAAAASAQSSSAIANATQAAPSAPAAGAAPPRKAPILLPVGPIRVDIMTLRELIYKVDEYVYFGTAISEEELRGMELVITRLKSRYGGMMTPLR